jgi:hypothetical protein
MMRTERHVALHLRWLDDQHAANGTRAPEDCARWPTPAVTGAVARNSGRLPRAAATVQPVKATEWAVLVSAMASSTAAVASVATWWRGRLTVSWEVQRPEKGGRWRVVNVGERVAKDARIRVGRLADPTHVASSTQAAALAKGEGLMVLVIPPKDVDASRRLSDDGARLFVLRSRALN